MNCDVRGPDGQACVLESGHKSDHEGNDGGIPPPRWKNTLLCWGNPKKIYSTEEHNDTYVADGAPPGAYVPNMGEDDKFRWKAKKIGGKDPRVEIRKTTEGRWCPVRMRYEGRAQALVVVRNPVLGGPYVTMSANGKAEFDVAELKQAVDEAIEALL